MEKENVILLHGLLRTENSFQKLERVLENKNYHVVNQGYPSRDHTIEELALSTIDKAIKKCHPGHKIHFVTHSMGGILLRYYLSVKTIPNFGNVVMLAPPNRGSQVVDRLGKFKFFHFFNGPSGAQLGTDEDCLPNKIGPASFNVGVIAGSRSVNPLLSCLLPGQDDGKVTVENTKLVGMKDHIVLPVTHTFMMNNPKVSEQVLTFLKSGAFEHANQ